MANAILDPASTYIQKEISRSRSAVLSYILKLKKSLDARHVDLLETLTKRFSERTIDYITYGHFRLLENFTLEPHQVAALASITEQVLDFDAQYGGHEPFAPAKLREDLENLALALETRFEIEDELLLSCT